MGDHGRFIPLADNAHIDVFVGYEIDSEWTPLDYENQEISGLRQKPGLAQLRVLSANWIRLRSLRARRFVLQFTEKNLKLVTDHIIALYEGVEYELILHTTADRYPADRLEFAKVISTWRLTPRTG